MAEGGPELRPPSDLSLDFFLSFEKEKKEKWKKKGGEDGKTERTIE